MNIILDLDNTIISSLSRDEMIKDAKVVTENMDKGLRWLDMPDSDFRVFARPNLDKFLDFLFENFNVSVWTAASKLYALFITENFILNKKGRKLDFVLFSTHCKFSNKKSKCQKKLKLLNDAFKLSKYQRNNTVIIDDNEDVVGGNKKNSILIKPFEANEKGAYNDNELLNVVIPKIYSILESMNKNVVGGKLSR